MANVERLTRTIGEISMKQPDILGLFTGISNKPIDPTTMTQAQQRSAMHSGLLSSARQGMVNAFGGETKEQKMQAQRADYLYKFDSLPVEEQKKAVYQLQAAGETGLAGQLASRVQSNQQKTAEGNRREALITQADSLNLPETSTLLQNGGSLDKAAEDIRKAQETKIVNEQGRKGKVAIANNRNVGEPMLKAIAKGDYDSLSNEDFMKVLTGEKATLKVYTDSSGQAKPFRVNESGRVYNKTTEKWVMPSELGLTQAAQLTKTITDADRISSKLKDKATDNFFVANEKALTAQKILGINANSRSLMEEGIITGAGANFLAGMASIGVQLGIVPQGVEDTLIATQTFMAERGKQVLALLGSGDVGSGTGISDNDVKFMKEVAGQQITLNKETLARIMRIEERAARNAIATSNSRLEVMKQYVGADEDSALLDTFFVPMPEPSVTGYVPTQASQTYLEQARNRRTQQVPQ